MGVRRTLLVANRGEIAVRIFSTCRRLGLRTVAVAGPGDEGALHTRVADSVVPVTSYLDAIALVAAARESGAELVHPGYGFLAESASFAEAVLGAGLTWVGPPPEALRQRRRQARGEADRGRRRRPDAPDRRPRGARLPAARQGGGRRRRARDAGRARARASSGRPWCPRHARPRRRSATAPSTASDSCPAPGTSRCSSWATGTATSSRSESATAPSSDATRR